MPTAPPRVCTFPGCGGAHTGPCPQRQQRNRRAEASRATSRRRGYVTAWDKARLIFLASHRLCAVCEREGRLTPATVVDHIRPHQGNFDLFWNQANWQALCAHCHAVKTAAEDGAFGNERRS